ncbi:MAG: multicopper oxidase family protein [Myxococcales bacterium]|nr:multicopper oxidase family protein [Myxococcales bacterium]
MRSIRASIQPTALLLVMLLSACGTESTSDSSQDAGASAASDAAGAASDAGAAAADTGPDVTEKVAQPLPKLIGPSVLKDINPKPGIVEVNLTTQVVSMKLHPDVPELPMFLYNGQFPGPTLRARVGDKVIVHFKNEIPQKTTVHWHGLRISDQMDGSPRIQKPVETGGTFTYEFVVPDAGTYWYHPHVRAHEQVERGLYGAIIVEEAENIGFTRDRMLVMDDIYLTKEGFGSFTAWPHPTTMHGRSGNVMLLNGERTPVAPAQAKKGDVERWRLVNTANARTMVVDVIGPAFVRVIGTDGGLLAKPYDLDNKKIVLPVGTRYDLEVAYYDKGTMQLRAHVPSAAPGGGVRYKPMLMQTVEIADDPKFKDLKTPVIPQPESLGSRPIDETVQMVFTAVEDPKSPAGVSWLINGKANAMAPVFTFKEGATVIMELENKAGPEHPFHLHGQFFEVLTVNGQNANLPGLKDTVLVPGQAKVRIKAYFDNPGQWMAHCHILEHAELGMMSEIVVTPKAK